MSLNLDNLKLVVICGPHPREKSGGESDWLDPDVEYDEDEEHFNTEFGFMTRVEISIQLNGSQVGVIEGEYINPNRMEERAFIGDLPYYLNAWSKQLGEFGYEILGLNGFMHNQLLKGGGWEDVAAHIMTVPYLYISKLEIYTPYRLNGIGRWALKQLTSGSEKTLSLAIALFVLVEPTAGTLPEFYEKAGFERLGNTAFFGRDRM